MIERGFHLVTSEIQSQLPKLPKTLVTSEIQSQLPKLPKTGIVNIFTKHTSCGLSINEVVEQMRNLNKS